MSVPSSGLYSFFVKTNTTGKFFRNLNSRPILEHSCVQPLQFNIYMREEDQKPLGCETFFSRVVVQII